MDCGVENQTSNQEPPYGEPVQTLADLDSLDSDEMVEGYRDGRAGEPEPKGNRSRSYWHGWRNGAVDGGHREKDAAGAALARVVVAASRKVIPHREAI